jgi:hypothetical protein
MNTSHKDKIILTILLLFTIKYYRFVSNNNTKYKLVAYLQQILVLEPLSVLLQIGLLHKVH